jgi:hypothetical protein
MRRMEFEQQAYHEQSPARVLFEPLQRNEVSEVPQWGEFRRPQRGVTQTDLRHERVRVHVLLLIGV